MHAKPTVAPKNLAPSCAVPRVASFSPNLHVGGCRLLGRGSQPTHECNIHAPVLWRRGAGRFEQKCVCFAKRALCLELVGNRAHGACEWVSAAKSRQECGGGVLSLDTITADPPVLIRHAGFLGEQALAHTHSSLAACERRIVVVFASASPSSGFRTLASAHSLRELSD